MGALHLIFTSIIIWSTDLLTIFNRHKLIKHLNEIFQINVALKALWPEGELFDDKLFRRIKLRMIFVVLQIIAIMLTVNTYRSRSFSYFKYAIVIQSFMIFGYIYSIVLTSIYLGGSLMLGEGYFRFLNRKILQLTEEVNEKKIQKNQCLNKLRVNETVNQISKLYDRVNEFVENGQKLIGPQTLVCLCSAFIKMLNAVRLLWNIVDVNKL